MARKWTKKDLIRVFELLLESGCTITSSDEFRKHLNRDENLFANQVTREANGNIAYRSVDFDVLDMEDEAFWHNIDHSPYSELILENAAVAVMKMAEKLEILKD